MSKLAVLLIAFALISCKRKIVKHASSYKLTMLISNAVMLTMEMDGRQLKSSTMA